MFGRMKLKNLKRRGNARSVEQYIQAFKPLYYLAAVPVLVFTVQLGLIYQKYRKSAYSGASGNHYLKVVFNKGLYGEFLLFSLLEKLPGNNKLLTNIYLPTRDGKTTEIDVVMLNSTGIYVFENKNYGGWIFGDESSKFWTQLFKGGKKIKFLNPIWQNQGHIKALQQELKEVSPGFYYSYIVFGERCELKKVSNSEVNVTIAKRSRLSKELKNKIETRSQVFDDSRLMMLYESLRKFSLVDQAVKLEHIQNIKSRVRKSN